MNRGKLIKELSQCVHIDRDALDEEIVQFPEVFYQVCEQTRQTESELNELRVERLQVEAELQDKAREKLEEDGVRVTNASINAWVRKRIGYKSADRKYQEAKAEHSKWAALKEAMQAKSYKLRDLVDLYTAQYFSDPSGSDGTTVKRRRQIREASRSRG